MKKALEVSLGIVTSVGGFLEMGEVSTVAQAGASFGFALLWAVVLGTACIICLTEMAGRFAAVSGHTITDAMRDRFGIKLFLWPLVTTCVVSLATLSAEIAGVSVALEFATGIDYRWFVVPAACATWLLLWRGTFGLIEKGVALLGLVTLCFVPAAWLARPAWREVAAGALPHLPHGHSTHYWFMAASILGASISPSLFLFYSSGAIEDRWDRGFLGANRVIAFVGMIFGGVISAAVLILAGSVLRSAGIHRVQDFHQLPLLLIPAFGLAGFVLFAASLGISSLGAALEVGLQQAYTVAQGFGWNWGEDCKPRDNPGFSLVYTVSLALCTLPLLCGADPLQLTIATMALTAISLPFAVVPFLVLMNDKAYMGEHRNGPFGNCAVAFVVALAFVLGAVALPLNIVGGN